MKKTECIIVGAGQAGLSVAKALRKKRIDCVLLEKDRRIGDVWRRRQDSMRLFTSRAMTELPGLSMRGERNGYPDKHEVADYLERYARYYDLDLCTEMEVKAVHCQDGMYQVYANDDRTFQAPCLVNATGANQLAIVPPEAEQLSEEVIQLSADQYQRPEQVGKGRKIIIVGDGSSGRMIARELSAEHQVTLFCGARRVFISHHIFGKDIFWWLTATRILYADTHSLIGKILRRRNPIPSKSLNDDKLVDAGIRLAGRLERCDGRYLIDSERRRYKADVVIWCLGYREDTRWLTLPDAVDEHGFICENGYQHGGKTPYPGLFIVGKKWLSCRGSELVQGAAKDAMRVADWIECYLDDFSKNQTTLRDNER
ncbi:flavin-containing monooxygenase [Brenneria rubrifaciens]|uniref:Potassium uptake trka-like protein n=1 Tax=Brenneria rubrifaciens TaxID=55213 RepID=A0A4P8QSP0_9GAMM|nr:NAD(P)/FAD-dependent oxidoreductase [Brenneria rubrifaciens]QCR08380.1 potassium uptake trka-like protein [Brenneria rubrifaciens]